jgi:hypothetical protein
MSAIGLSRAARAVTATLVITTLLTIVSPVSGSAKPTKCPTARACGGTTTPTPTPMPSPTTSPTPTPTPTASPGPGGTWSPSPTATSTPTPTTAPTLSPTPTATATSSPTAPLGSAPPAADGYFSLKGPGSLGSLPSGQECAGLVHRSTWEPRPKNTTANHTMPDPAAVHAAFAARPRAPLTNDERWDTWLLPRVDGQFTGTTDEIFQWAACKWGLPDNVLRAQAVRESVWFQYLTDTSGACQVNYGCTDVFSSSSAASRVYCDALARIGGYDYQRNFGTGICPKTFGIVSAMSWQDPSWGTWPDNQNGTFPFNRNSTPFVVDYLGAYLRGCYEGWAWWLTRTSGDLWGCVGSWYAGEWHSSAADGYASRVKDEIVNHRWLQASF